MKKSRGYKPKKEKNYDVFLIKTRKQIEKNVTEEYLAKKYQIFNPWRYAELGIAAKGKYFLIAQN